jgi:hypothetical protein
VAYPSQWQAKSAGTGAWRRPQLGHAGKLLDWSERWPAAISSLSVDEEVLFEAFTGQCKSFPQNIPVTSN